MPLWTYEAYVSEGGSVQPHEWYQAQDDRVKAACYDILAELIGKRPHWKGVPYYEDMKKEHAGLGEIRIPVGSKGDPDFRRVRFFGFCYPNERRFVILVSFEKSRDAPTNPPDAEALALTLKADYEAGKGKTIKYEFA